MYLVALSNTTHTDRGAKIFFFNFVGITSVKRTPHYSIIQKKKFKKINMSEHTLFNNTCVTDRCGGLYTAFITSIIQYFKYTGIK